MAVVMMSSRREGGRRNDVDMMAMREDEMVESSKSDLV